MKTKGLTLKEAIESGKPFRRAGEPAWISISNEPLNLDILLKQFSAYDVLLEDWEIKVNPREFWILRRLNTIDIVVHHPDLIDNYKDLIEVIHVKEVIE